MHERDLVLSAQVDHIISLKHGGLTDAENLAYSCLVCNANKGSNIASMVPPNETLVRLFNPRKDIWTDHFELQNGVIHPKTMVGKATVKTLDLNAPERIARRLSLIETGHYPIK